MKVLSSITVKRGLLVLLLAICACGPTVKYIVPVESIKIKTIAILPTQLKSDLRRERIDYLITQLNSELNSRSFIIVDPSLANKICQPEQAQADCDQPEVFSDKYGVDGFIQLQIDSVSRTNLIAATYNAIRGKLVLYNPMMKKVAQISASESERGGLLFNSGQLVVGLESTLENSEDHSFNLSAQNLIQALVGKLPVAATELGAVSEQLPAPSILGVTFKNLGKSRYEVCLDGQAGDSAFLLIDKTRSELREVSKGRYCSKLLLGGVLQEQTRFRAELRTAYGIAEEREIDLTNLLSCNLEGAVVVSSDQSVTVGCANSLTNEQLVQCELMLKRCRQANILVYKGVGEIGPYQQILSRPIQITGTKLNVDLSKQEEEFLVASESSSGELSVPINLKTVGTK